MEDHTMSGSDSVPILITGGAAIVGALAGGAIGWLSAWTAMHRSGKDSRDDRRRAAYAAFIAAQEELRRILLAWETVEPPPAAESRFGPAVAQTVSSVDRAFVAVVLAGPRKAKDHADDVRDQAWGVYNVIYLPEGPGRPADPKLGKRVDGYIAACDVFSRTASEVLGTR
jgi:gas vesicle protein